MRSKSLRRNHEAGIALISVLWVLLLLSSLAATVAYVARTNAILRHRSAQIAQTNAAAEAAIADAIRNLSDDRLTHRPAIDAQPRDDEFYGVHTVVAISNEAGRIDINTADDDLLSSFLQSQQIEAGRAEMLVNDLRTFQKTVPGLPMAHPLMDLAELRNVPSWKLTDLNCWEDALTVYSGATGVSQQESPEPVVNALKWAQERRIGGKDWLSSGNAMAEMSGHSPLGKVLRIVATASSAPDAVSTIEWVGRITGDASRPALTMRWNGHAATSCRSATEKF